MNYKRKKSDNIEFKFDFFVLFEWMTCDFSFFPLKFGRDSGILNDSMLLFSMLIHDHDTMIQWCFDLQSK